MTPEDKLARTRFATISAIRAMGTVIMLMGLWIWLGNTVRSGGWPELGVPLFIFGMVDSLVVPHVLLKQWRSRP